MLPGTFVVNLGDLLERWTRGMFVSTMHRVRHAQGKTFQFWRRIASWLGTLVRP